MKHPRSLAERRHNDEVFRSSRRRLLVNWFYYYRTGQQDPRNNKWWFAVKRSNNHGNRCLCHFEKRDRKSVRQRRRALDAEIAFSWKAEREEPMPM